MEAAKAESFAPHEKSSSQQPMGSHPAIHDAKEEQDNSPAEFPKPYIDCFEYLEKEVHYYRDRLHGNYKIAMKALDEMDAAEASASFQKVRHYLREIMEATDYENSLKYYVKATPRNILARQSEEDPHLGDKLS